MIETSTIEVPLPEGMEADSHDLEVLRATFATIVTLVRECGNESNEDLQKMTDDGWQVGWRLTWTAKAKKGKISETASGSTKELTLARLRQFTRLHDVDGCP